MPPSPVPKSETFKVPQAFAQALAPDAPHILIYPGLLMDISSIQLAAQRLARVQCNSWDHPETSGLPTMDSCRAI